MPVSGCLFSHSSKDLFNTLAWDLLVTGSIEKLMKIILTYKHTHKILYAISRGEVYKILHLIKVQNSALGNFIHRLEFFIKITSRLARHIWPFNNYPAVYPHRFSFYCCSDIKTELIFSFHEVHYHLLSHCNNHQNHHHLHHHRSGIPSLPPGMQLSQHLIKVNKPSQLYFLKVWGCQNLSVFQF